MNVGDKYGNLVVVALDAGKHLNGKPLVRVRCSCGNEVDKLKANVHSGVTVRCDRHCSDKIWPHRHGVGEAAMRNRYSRYRTSAESRGLVFDITIDQFQEIAEKDCHYCNEPPSNIARVRVSSGSGSWLYSGLDRIDSGRGYTYTNLVPCCITCNRWKGAFEKQKFLDHVERIYNHAKNVTMVSRRKHDAKARRES